MTRLLTAVLVLAGLHLPAVALAEPVVASAEVLRAVDGDTMDVRDDVRGRLRIRVLGIDTPETNKPGYTVGCWGPQASDFARETLVGQRVAVVYDPTQDIHDRYGRTLAYLVKPEGWNYSVEAARAGMAKAYIYAGQPVQLYPQIAAAEQEARDTGRGLWGIPCSGDTAAVPR